MEERREGGLNVLDLLEGERGFWWRLPDPGGPELLRASYHNRTFARHSHDRLALGVVTTGGLAFRYRGLDVLAPAGWVNLAYPGEAHTGRSAGPEGWSYRMFYLDPDLLLQAARALDPDHGRLPFLAAGAVRDPDLAVRILRLHRLCEDPEGEPLARQAGLAELLVLLVARHAGEAPAPRSGREPQAAARARDLLVAAADRPVSLAELAAAAGLNPFRLVRCFTREYGLPPHAFLIQVRLQRAARLLRRGQSPVRAALDAGFADQSHLHRHFLKCYGLTPGEYRRGSAAPR